MNTLREAALLALGALEGGADSWRLVDPAINALKAALAEPMQEPTVPSDYSHSHQPVAWVCYGSSSDEKHAIDYQQEDIDAVPVGTMLYTAPPTALRAALAEQPGSIPQHERLKQMEAQRLAELVQEPTVPSDCADSHQSVAWMVYTPDGKSVCVTDNPADFTDQHKALPLYTAPPRCPNCASLEAQNTELDRKLADRKPLTDEEIDRITRDRWGTQLLGVMVQAHREYARAVEAAHGIGGQDE